MHKNNINLIERLSILDYGGQNILELKDNLTTIDERLSQDLNNLDDPLFELNWNQRNRIIELLFKNFHTIVLINNHVSKGNKKGLIKENSDMIQLLLNLRPYHTDPTMTDNIEGDLNCFIIISLKFIISTRLQILKNMHQ